MSGHSKWHSIKHKKAAKDAKRSKLFGQLSRDIRTASRAGADPEKNAALREAIERAKKFNLPQSNIDRLLNKGAAPLTDVTYEGYGPGGVAMMVSAATDNTNRTVAEVRNIFKSHGASLGEAGSAAWKFQRQADGSFTVDASQRLALDDDSQEKLERLLSDLEDNDDILTVYTDAVE